MTPGDPFIHVDAPISLRDARKLLAADEPHIHHMASLARLPGGRLALSFSRIQGTRRLNNGVLVVSRSDDKGTTWTTPEPLYAHTGWDCLNMGGLMPFGDERLLLLLGRLQIDPTLPGDEPCTGWHMATRASSDGGETWSSVSPEIRLFPGWTELYGASNPHRLADGRHMLAAIGTTGRDCGWRAGVTFTDDLGATFSPPVIVAEHPRLGFGDMDVVRLSDGRFLAVARVFGGHPSVFAHSGDEGQTWTEPRETNFAGANIKLHRLRSGAVLCAYRDERGNRSGVACSISEDAGESWQRVGWLAAPSPGEPPKADGVRCGYPDIVQINDRNLACVLHPAADATGGVDLRWLRLVDRT